ncbi:hypothetical protein Metfor_1739 [Methanoregula formicica SMSP]|uniref:Uncharacterized protein n=1 Tax=Methanoregula formicica (strain DSM 22288 / NBRC 105244 / SMSP) TaxID=593750 RepID=L0HI68_METFS|nr:hypothetical protein Metfor_1739 [Methanoregula formicica SMSP]
MSCALTGSDSPLTNTLIIHCARNRITGDVPLSENQRSDAVKSLVKFMICLAIAGTIIALVWYFAIDLPVQQAAAIHVPTNTLVPL